MNSNNLENFQKYNYDPANPTKTVPLVDLNGLTKEIAQQLYYQAVRLRRGEEELIREYHPADEMRCPVHFCIGQEAAPAALALLLKSEDYLFSHHRSHGFFVAKTQSLNPLFAEMYGKENGANKGRAGSQDISFSSARFYSGAILAGTVPIAAGAALAFQLNKDPHISVTATGDGATDEGVYWEALNYAGLKKLPMLFVCENNNYSTYSPQRRRSAQGNISERVKTFGVESRAFFGNDIARTYLEIKKAIEEIRSGSGPVFLETFTYRWNAHVGPEDDDVNEYRSVEEREYWKKLCPILLLEKRMFAAGWLTEDSKKAVYQKAEKEVADAFKFAKEGKFPAGANWQAFNTSEKSPLADKLLLNEQDLSFNASQAELIPGPY